MFQNQLAHQQFLRWTQEFNAANLGAPEEDKEEAQEATAGLAAAKEICVDAAVATVFLELDGIFTFNLLLCGNDVCVLPLTGFCQEFC